jgi:N6-L-threonylcarbamoyladenine synthase
MPVAAYNYHMATVANMVKEFCTKHGISARTPPDLLCVTRGPGMAGSLSASTEFAKGLAVAWDVPLIGVHHMLGHLLTANLPKKEQPNSAPPQYPFLSLLCSGGHTMLVFLKSLTEHEILVNVSDIAVGDSLDKCARELGMYGNMLGKELEKYIDAIPADEKEEFRNIRVDTREANVFNFRANLPFGSPKYSNLEDIKFAFAHFLSNIQQYKTRYYTGGDTLDEKTKRFIAFKTQELVFDHIIDRINVAFKKHGISNRNSDGAVIGVKDFICSGGVAANRRLREKLLQDLKLEELAVDKVSFHFPDLSLCTDNAIMIGAAGIEIFEKLRLKTDLAFLPIRKWPLNNLLDVDGWVKVKDEEYNRICK